jgi:hypothetical protein
MLDMNQPTPNLDEFISNALLRASNVEGYSINNYLRWALDESQIGNFANERQSWKNFLEVKPAELIKSQSAPIPVFSTLLLAGTNAAEPGTFIGNQTRPPYSTHGLPKRVQHNFRLGGSYLINNYLLEQWKFSSHLCQKECSKAHYQ